MLKQLYIQNFTLITELNMRFNPGFSVITGETGAGKSIILGAIGLLLGNRADSKQIHPGAKKCVIEAHFDLSRYGMDDFFERNGLDVDPNDTIIRRELTAAGKSRAFINDTPVPLTTMRELGETLVDIHSQHQNLLLKKDDFQLSVVDIIAKDQGLLKDYRNAYQEYRKAEQQLETLKAEIIKSKENEDFLRFQFKEIDDAHLQADEQQTLEQQSETMSHAEEIKTALWQTDQMLTGEDNDLVDQVKNAAQKLHNIEAVFADAKDLADRLDSSYIELKDISQEVSNSMENVEFDPQQLQEINERLDTIYSLQQKFHVETIADLLKIKDDIDEQLSHIDNSDAQVAELESRVTKLQEKSQQLADRLSQARAKSAQQVEKEMRERLIPLGIPNVRFQVSITPKPLSADGCDKVAFLFSANKNMQLQPVAQVASGGEIARVMLSLKAMISGAVKLPTIIFDEIDTGVSGSIAEKMAQIMKEMGDNNRQVISITHLPQIAAMGTTHYKVYKEDTPEGTVSHMRMLSPEERVKEIAQMLSGSDITDAAISNARSLLKLSQK
ncbi:DNA repair protein RecN [Prevotella sp. AGR2160]|uniref:DNA repair protein RecN n=1 Tax=Prevotella sp. AGR2160 TaxID=1280674 RepID=UPI0003F968E3|nr:DNA repair protein RecN [Prevotella sp. AGR2160]